MVSFYQNRNDYGLQKLNIETLEMLDKNSIQMLDKIKEQKILVKHNISKRTLSELKKPKTEINYFNDAFYISNTTQLINIKQYHELKRNRQNKRNNSYKPYSTEREGLSFYRQTRSLSNKNPQKKNIEKENQVDMERILEEMLLMGECIFDDLEKIAQENSLNF